MYSQIHLFPLDIPPPIKMLLSSGCGLLVLKNATSASDVTKGTSKATLVLCCKLFRVWFFFFFSNHRMTSLWSLLNETGNKMDTLEQSKTSERKSHRAIYRDSQHSNSVFCRNINWVPLSLFMWEPYLQTKTFHKLLCVEFYGLGLGVVCCLCFLLCLLPVVV